MMAHFQYAQLQDYAALTALWRTCFGDSPADIEAFWRITKPTVFLAKERERVVSMACALDCTLIDDCGEALPAAYLYAICTAPEERGRGLSKGLMEFAEQELKKTAAFTVLVPAGSDLFDFYRKLGYQTAFYHKKYCITAGDNAKITRLDIDGYRNLRDLQLYGAFLSYDAKLLQWQDYLSQADNAGLYRIETAQAVCCAAAQKRGDSLIIKELLPDCPEAAAALAAKLHCRDAEVRTEGLQLPFGMLKALSDVPTPAQAYLGLAFD